MAGSCKLHEQNTLQVIIDTFTILQTTSVPTNPQSHSSSNRHTVTCFVTLIVLNLRFLQINFLKQRITIQFLRLLLLFLD
ncbi:hypothetical protein BCR33DRAFT_127380 [Rhizoclosmatium globosum]|uniref:Uncharacterized protein n=1 Tax=Rhizoclosmatium globosum TaxID=329046 RepID=A0A1Y2CH33_9FUNG|nr:hypothetical protein BCR33DRAFT_127380 [Rhizoclosmatium globosum]|eukprot:ORY46358.1 hypothetical protein BCR33DRAFT_127380 [Rhizoclosmatium globosum]